MEHNTEVVIPLGDLLSLFYTADGGCPSCGKGLCGQLLRTKPEYTDVVVAWLMAEKGLKESECTIARLDPRGEPVEW